MNFRKGLSAATFAAFGIFSIGTAHATIMGAAYFVSEAEANNAIIGFAHGAPNATFTVPNGAIDFDSRTCGTCYTLGGFLGSGGATILTGSAGDLATNLDTALGGTMIEFKGKVSVTNGQTFTVTHDDGLQLMIGALLVVDKPGPTAPSVTTVTYTGATGTFDFDLVWGECCGPPAVLATSLPLIGNVPEPATLALLGVGLAGLGWSRRRKPH